MSAPISVSPAELIDRLDDQVERLAAQIEQERWLRKRFVAALVATRPYIDEARERAAFDPAKHLAERLLATIDAVLSDAGEAP